MLIVVVVSIFPLLLLTTTNTGVYYVFTAIAAAITQGGFRRHSQDDVSVRFQISRKRREIASSQISIPQTRG
jgi:hypothetical protein